MRHDESSSEFDAMFAQMARRSRDDRFVPNTDVSLSEDGRYLLVQVELAGVDPASVRLEVGERALYLTGVRRHEAPWLPGNCILKEIEYGAFERKIHLPVTIEQSEATGLYRDGILSLTLPLASHSEFPIIRTEIRLILTRVSA